MGIYHYDDYPIKIENLENLTIYDKETGKTWKDIFRYDGVDTTGLIDDLPGMKKNSNIILKYYL